MARAADERKRRPREHIIADLSVNFVERLILLEGHVPYRVTPDYGYDLRMVTFDEDRLVEPGLVHWQLKASESWTVDGGRIAYDLDVRDYRLWMAEGDLVILALYDAMLERCYWIHAQDHFVTERTRPRPDAKTVRLWLPESQRLTRRAVRQIRQEKQRIAGGFTLRIV